jgi:acyl-CoA synthetase (NDP forming)
LAPSSDLSHLFNPHSIAVVGASPDPTKIGFEVFNNLATSKRMGSFTGEIYPVNPRYAEVGGLSCFPNVASIKGDLDLAVVVVPSQSTPAVMSDLAAKGVPAAVIISGGFSEVGAKELEDEVIRIAAENGIRVLGPNTLGIQDPYIGLDTFFLPEWKTTTNRHEAISSPKARPGSIVLVSQSGGVGAALIDYIVGSGAGLRAFVGLGNQADVTLDEVISYYADDPKTKAILLYVEGVRKGRNLIEACSAASKKKPIVALKAGKTVSGRRAAFTHTASMVGQEEVYSMAFHQGGIVEVSTIEDLFDAGKSLSMLDPPSGDRVIIVTNGGGAGVIAADSCEGLGLKVPPLSEGAARSLEEMGRAGKLPPMISPNNPLDLTGSASSETFRLASDALKGGDMFDAWLYITLHHAPAVYDDVVDVVSSVHKERGQPVVACDVGEAEWARIMRSKYESHGIPCFPTPDRAAKAIHFLSRYGSMKDDPELWRDTQATVDKVGWLGQYREAGKESVLLEPGASRLLAEYSLPLLASSVATDEDSAVRAADIMGYPVAMKIVASSLSHKTDVGGVVLNVGDSIGVRGNFEALKRKAGEVGLSDSFRGILVQKMAGAGFELLIGSYRDRFFGPVITLGAGGTYTELVRDFTLRVAPFSVGEAEEMMNELRISRILKGYRGKAPYDVECLKDVIVKLSRMMLENPSINQMEFNPFFVFASGGAVVDARVLLS